MANQALIRAEGIGKQYATGAAATLPALHDVNLSVFPGEFVAIMGPSGSGKSTFMNIIGCLDSPTTGTYYFENRNVAHFSVDELAQLRNQVLGFVFQGFNLLKRNTVLENVALPLFYARISKSERVNRARDLLRQMGLEKHMDYFPNQLSGGQQQRVAIARALANHPKLILADEPTGNLDTKTSTEIMDIFERLNRDQGITLMLVTHEEDIAARAKRLIRFKDGAVVYDGDNPSKATKSTPVSNPHP